MKGSIPDFRCNNSVFRSIMKTTKREMTSIENSSFFNFFEFYCFERMGQLGDFVPMNSTVLYEECFY